MGWKRNKMTGEVAWFDDGTTPIPIGPRNPAKQAVNDMQPEQVRGQIASTSTGTANTATNTARTQQIMSQTPISTEDQAILAKMRVQAQSAGKARQILDRSAGVIDKFQTGPDRASVVRNAIPSNDSGRVGRWLAGANAWMDGVTPEDIQNYSYLQAGTQERVAARQEEQTGPQTESDAQRYMMADIDPAKPAPVNAEIVGQGLTRAMLDQERPDFYAKWANQYGSLGKVVNGRSVDKAWSDFETQRIAAYNRELQGRKTLNSEIARQAEKFARENPNATPAQKQMFHKVLNDRAREEYKNRTAKPAAGVKFLGFE